MRNRFLALTMLVVGLMSASTAAAERPVGVGDRAPNFSLLDHTGKSVTLSETRGEKVVLVFYRGHW